MSTNLHPTLERFGDVFVVVVQRCATRDAAQEWFKRASGTGVHCDIDENWIDDTQTGGQDHAVVEKGNWP